MKIFMILTMIFLATNLNYSQTTYYVSSTSGNDSYTGRSADKAWKSLSKVNSVNFLPGDSILFKGGEKFTGQISFSSSGTKSNPICISAYSNNNDNFPILDGNKILAYVIQFESEVGYYSLSNLKLTDYDPEKGKGVIKGILLNSNITFDNCHFSQNKIATDGNSAVVEMIDPNNISFNKCDFTGKSQMILFIANSNSNHNDIYNISISNCNFHDISTKINSSDYGGNSRAIRMYSNYKNGVGTILGKEGIVRDILITNNRFSNIASVAIWNEPFPVFTEAGLTSYNINIENNYFHKVENCAMDWSSISNRNGKFNWSSWSNNFIDSCGFDIDGIETDDYPTNAIQTHAAKNLMIFNNTISEVGSNSGDGHGIILDYANDSKLYICDSVIVVANTVSGCTRGSSGSTSGINNFKGRNCLIAFNICFNNQAGIKAESDNSKDNMYVNNVLDDNIYGIYNGSSAPGNIIMNNIISNNNIFGIRAHVNETHDYNCFYNNDKNYSGTQSGTHDILTDPEFIDHQNRNYHLKQNSPCINHAFNLYTKYTNVNLPIYPNQALDIGAYQSDNSAKKFVTIDCKVFLQGPYKNGEMSTIYSSNGFLPMTDPYLNTYKITNTPSEIVDWVLVELRSDVSPTSIVAQKSGLLRFDGRIVDIDGSKLIINNVEEGKYYIVIKHRNHLSIMSSESITLNSNSNLYDFTTDEGKAYGNRCNGKIG